MIYEILGLLLPAVMAAPIDTAELVKTDSARLMDEVVVSATRDRVAGSRLPYSVGVYTRRDMQSPVPFRKHFRGWPEYIFKKLITAVVLLLCVV
jgi:hypothetical protein